jgi:hypothetical protein
MKAPLVYVPREPEEVAGIVMVPMVMPFASLPPQGLFVL